MLAKTDVRGVTNMNTTDVSYSSVNIKTQIKLSPLCSIHYMMYWLRLHPVVRPSGLMCRSPPEYTGESVEEYVRSYNRGCPKERQQSPRDQTESDELLWNSLEEVQGEPEEEIEPSHLRQPQKYQIIRLS